MDIREKKGKIVIEGNEVYEIDLECLRKKQQQKYRNNMRKENQQSKKRQGT